MGGFPGGPVVKNPVSSEGSIGSIPGRGTKVPHAARCSQKCLKMKTQTCGEIVNKCWRLINIKFRIVITPRREGRGMGSDKGKEGTSKVFVIFFPYIG